MSSPVLQFLPPGQAKQVIQCSHLCEYLIIGFPWCTLQVKETASTWCREVTGRAWKHLIHHFSRSRNCTGVFFLRTWTSSCRTAPSKATAGTTSMVPQRCRCKALQGNILGQTGAFFVVKHSSGGKNKSCRIRSS